ncbi:hypothetical protein FQR65_LT03886 [Abscondita terminalis]|nr:hypothetical protein FQR65_LT03886 [Abscondita terminalis]
MGPWGDDSLAYHDFVGKKLVDISGDPRAKEYLCQRISLAIQMGNAGSHKQARECAMPFSKVASVQFDARLVSVGNAKRDGFVLPKLKRAGRERRNLKYRSRRSQKLVFKQLLVLLLKDYASIIENKASNKNSNKRKSNNWKENHQKFNTATNRRRELSQLQVQWKTMKIVARKNVSHSKRERGRTGSRPKPSSPILVDMEIINLLNLGESIRDENKWDCDDSLPIFDPTLAIITTKVKNEDLSNKEESDSSNSLDQRIILEELKSIAANTPEVITIAEWNTTTFNTSYPINNVTQIGKCRDPVFKQTSPF